MKKKLLDILTSLKIRLRDKNGSTTVLVLIVLTTVITITIMMVNLSKEKAQQGCERAALSISARSVLSEYNKPLKEQYGLLGINLSPSEISDKMNFYIKKILEKKLRI